jgi:hypothetical protein
MARLRHHCRAGPIHTVVLVLGFCAGARAAEFAGGTGEPNDPYRIATPEQLVALGSDPNLLDKHFTLVADVDLDPNQPGGMVFDRAVIAPDTDDFREGFQGVAFTGLFNGQGHRIRGLTIRSENQHVGLFGLVGTGGQIRDLGVIDAEIEVSVDTSKRGGGSSGMGILAGESMGSMVRCYTSGTIRSTIAAGGLVGTNRGSISLCFAQALVEGTWQAGGLVSLNYYGSVDNCYASGTVLGQGSRGGLIGSHEGVVNCCYAAASVPAYEDEGSRGGLIGASYGQVALCFWDVQASGLSRSAGGFGRTTVEMKQSSTFVGWGDGCWSLAEGQDYPHLTWENMPGAPLGKAPQRTYSGSGSIQDPFLLSRAEDWFCLMSRRDDWSGVFHLTADIDMTGIQGYLPPGDFRGSIDGKGHVISHLTIDERGSLIGLVGYLNGGSIRNLTLADVTIAGTGECIGGLVGRADHAEIAYCRVMGRIAAAERSSDIGGLVGSTLYGMVRCCYSTGEVSVGNRGRRLGGLAGSNENGGIRNSYTRSCVSCGSDCGYVGGLVGYHDREYFWHNIYGCYAAGRIQAGPGTTLVGGLAGITSQESTSGSFWDIEVSGVTTGFGGARGLTTVQMQDVLTYVDAGWDFACESTNGSMDYWIMPEGGTYPELRVFSEYEAPVLAGDGSADDPYQIATPEDLRAINRLDWSAHYRLVSSIDLSGITWTTAPIPVFHGVFDGAGYTISNLHVQGGSHLGLFGVVKDGAVVRRLSLASADVRSSQESWHVGLLAGDNLGLLFDCQASGQISTAQNCQRIGGLVGANSGSVWCCSSEGSVTTDAGCQMTGGLAGGNDGRILDCGTTSNITYGRDCNDIGGLVGAYPFHLHRDSIETVIEASADLHEISFSYAAGRISGTSENQRVGGLVGFRERGPVYRCFWDLESTGLADSSGGTGLTSAQMHSAQTFLDAGWDFGEERENGVADLWSMPADSGPPKLTIFAQGYAIEPLLGRGTPEAPYEIASAQDLAAIRHVDPSASYRLTCDVNLAGITWGEAPIPELHGCLDGAGFAITGLTVQGGKLLGLCGTVGAQASVKNLALVDVHIAGDDQTAYAGAVTGISWGRIRNCQTTGFISGQYCVGALAGINFGTMQQCRVTATVTGKGDSLNTGGLVGLNGGSIRNSCSQSMTSGEENVGGLVGYDWSGVTACYAGGEVWGRRHVGGLVGWLDGMGTSLNLVHCYSTARVSGPTDATSLGGLVGYPFFAESKIVQCFWDVEASGVSTSNDAGTGLSRAAMQNLKTYLDAGWDFAGESLNGIVDLWVMPSGGGYPQLLIFSDEAVLPRLAGSGTPQDPYQIATPKDLGLMSQFDEAACFRMVADIDLAGITWVEPPVPEFYGHFDGNRHAISNLTLRERDSEIAEGGPYGLFGCIGSGGVVTDLYLKGASIRAADYRLAVATLAGRNYGCVLRCMATGTVTAESESQTLGGLVGCNQATGTLEESFACVDVVRYGGNYIVGGLTAENDGIIHNCYATGTVGGERFVGGLVGWNEGMIECSYAAGRLSPYWDEQIGGLVGYSQGVQPEGVVERSFWDTQASEQTASDGGTGLPTAPMQTAATFEVADWDFAAVWTICEGRDYPRLWWEQVSCE